LRVFYLSPAIIVKAAACLLPVPCDHCIKKFDHTLEEAALNLGATRRQVIWYITLKFLRPAIVGSGAVAFLMSFENFNTTLFLVGSQATLPINLYLQVRDGSTPVINAISCLLIVGTSSLALFNLYLSRNVKAE